MGPSPLHKAQLRSALKNLPPFAGSLRCLWCRSMLYCMLGRKAHSLTLLLCLKENSWSVLIGQIRVWIWLMYTFKNFFNYLYVCWSVCCVCSWVWVPSKASGIQVLEAGVADSCKPPRCVLVAEVGFSAQAVHTPHCLIISAAPMWSALAAKMYSSSETVFKLHFWIELRTPYIKCMRLECFWLGSSGMDIFTFIEWDILKRGTEI